MKVKNKDKYAPPNLKKYKSKKPGKYIEKACKYCKKKMRSNNIKRHIGLMHGEKANSK